MSEVRVRIRFYIPCVIQVLVNIIIIYYSTRKQAALVLWLNVQVKKRQVIPS